MFYLVGSIYDSGYDDIYEIYDGVVENAMSGSSYGWQKEMVDVYGNLGGKIVAAVEDLDTKKVTRHEKAKILKAIDKYFDDVYGVTTFYKGKEGQLVVYQIPV